MFTGLRPGAGIRLVRDRASTTPGRLRLLSISVAAGSGLLWLAGSSVLIGSASALDGIGRGTVPAIVLTQEIHAALAAADRSAANAFLSGGVEIVEPRTEYEIEIATATRDLEQAAEHNRAGPEATEQLQAIGVLLAQYTGLVEQARANNRQGFPIGVAYLRDASRLMHRPGDGILARLDALGTLDARDLAREDAALTLSLVGAGVFGAVAAAVVGLLVHTQVFVRRRFNRQTSDLLLAATAAAALLTAWMGAQVAHTALEARGAGQTYARVHDLWLARSLVNDADGNVSLSLAAPGAGAEFDQAFTAESAQLGRLLEEQAAGAQRPEERAAAARTLDAYREFTSAGEAVRGAVARGDQAGAIAVALGTRPGQLAVVFGELDEAL
ncbi:MAG TPA: hypothetical protein VLW53_07175, partial [Candidatus Eisenbacteria bacterium]|nr:hypothetical protein [Candidatus Eisenbacteria bacterium]